VIIKLDQINEHNQKLVGGMAYLNDKYELDGGDPNSYTGVAWYFGKHDLTRIDGKTINIKHSLIVYLAAFLLLALVGWAYGDEGFAGAFNHQLGRLQPQVQFESNIICDESVAAQKTNLGFAQYDLNMELPLRQDESFESAFFSGIQAMDISTRARMDDAGVPLPDHLWDIMLGGRLRWRLENDWISGVSLSVSSPSDKPFESWDEIAINATGTLQIPAGYRSHHILMLNFATNREFLEGIPLPGYAYQWSSHRDVQLLLGLPFSWGQWKVTENLTVLSAYLIPRTVHAKISYELLDGLALYGGFDWQNQRWFRTDRDDNDDRLFYYEKKAALGLRWEIIKNWTIDLQGGYGFDRFFFEGEEYDDRGDNHISLSDGLFIGVQTGLRF